MRDRSAVPGFSKTDQQTTSLATAFSPEETITVIDPRHPLYGQTLRLIQFTKNAHHGPSCVVWLENGAERLIPIAATDRSPQPPTLYPQPLNLAASESLVRAYARIRTQIKERAENVQPTNQSVSDCPISPDQQRPADSTITGQSDPLRTTLEHSHRRATAGAVSQPRPRQSRARQPSNKQNRQRGG